ncbi:54S ribosomal protein L3, mitochondrial [Zancudomyces culisetae]|uniref:54S ribosomal protein L3, mitochondrial n=1 Tax=Zancudomyces culisetae TaxID=1213189 RepID=A0A1R1PVR7_ZANCU|nr:54S ribosomal protein L3, mitochondrial [Zancudomyces culisetae]|eukprot:OMH85029.1 54S ribosomal protein L3, mitochondrial [Zancudomyces culisetae]
MEYLDAKFPNLPPNVLVGLQQYHFVGLGPLSSFAKVVGLEYLVKWKPVGGQPGSPPIAGVGEIGGGGLTKVLVNAVQALIGAIHSSSIIKSKSKANNSNNNNNNNQNGNGDAAKEFIHKYLIPQYRLYDNQFYLHNNTTNDNLTAGSSAIIANLMNCTAYSSTNPKRVLKALLDRKGLPSKLHYRILKESGRLSANPVFIVGVFINNNNNNSSTQLIKIGEGFGSSIKMAEFRATRHALLSYYAKELNTFDLPSNPNYRPNRLGDTIAIP